MPDIVARDRNGNPITHTGVNVLTYDTPDGGKVDFVAGTTVEKSVALDFSAGNMEIVPEEDTFFSKVLIPKPDALIPENVAKGKTIAGVTGNMAGGEVKSRDKTIRFYDPYGEVIYGYTLAEIQELNELPPGPALTGLTFERWTHTLDELKATAYFADVGPMYKYGNSPATVFIVETIFANSPVRLHFDAGTTPKFTVYWGDGTSNAYTSLTNVAHTYAAVGVYNIAVVMTSGSMDVGEYSSSYLYNGMKQQISSATTSNGGMTAAPDFYLKSCLIGSYLYGGYPLTILYLPICNRLKFVSEYNAATRIVNSKKFALCPGLTTIAGNQPQKSPGSYSFWCCISLKRVVVSGSVNATAFVGCDSLEEVIYGSGNINEPRMNVQWTMLMTTETPPTIGATSPVWGTKPIYVPDAAVDTYKAADGWSNAADYIFPASKYRATH